MFSKITFNFLQTLIVKINVYTSSVCLMILANFLQIRFVFLFLENQFRLIIWLGFVIREPEL